MKITIMGADAERRAGLKTLVRRVARQAKFHEAQDWQEAHSIHKRSRPEMVVVDWAPALHPLDLHALLGGYPGIPAAVVIDQPAAPQVFMLMSAGATGIIPRALDPVLVLRALEMVTIGGHYIPPDIIDPQLGRDLMARRGQQKPLGTRRLHPEIDLSPRQQQIMRCVHMGCTNKMIAKMLNISEGTVKIHLTGIFQVLGATNRAAAVAIYNGVQASHLEILRANGVPDATPSESEEPEHAAEPAEASADTNAPVEPETATEQSAPGEPEPTDDAPTDPAIDASNVIELPVKRTEYPPLSDNNNGSWPMAAEPDSTF
jgi:DNA-binding NarL/FixJ family response regulator